MVSHGVLYLSRCTQWHWSRDVGTAYPLAKGGYRVRRESGKSVLGEVDTVEEAYELIAADYQREGDDRLRPPGRTGRTYAPSRPEVPGVRVRLPSESAGGVR
ncbi:DUF6193 family natural product biosynthesis protein [Streptomyces anulatus]